MHPRREGGTVGVLTFEAAACVRCMRVHSHVRHLYVRRVLCRCINTSTEPGQLAVSREMHAREGCFEKFPTCLGGTNVSIGPRADLFSAILYSAWLRRYDAQTTCLCTWSLYCSVGNKSICSAQVLNLQVCLMASRESWRTDD